MNIEQNEYVEIEHADGFGIKPQGKVYTENLPDVIVSNIPIELQQFDYSLSGKGHRVAYSYRPTMTLKFSNKQFPAPLKSKLHKHDYFELMLVSSGQMSMQIESQLCEFNNWDVCVLNRTTRHAEHFKPGIKVFYLALSADYLQNWPSEEGMGLQHFPLFRKFFNKGLRDTLQQNKDYIDARYTNQTAVSPLCPIIGDIRRELETKHPGYQLIVRGLLLRLFNVLTHSKDYETQYIDLGADEGFSLAYSAKKILDKHKRKMTKHEIALQLNYNSEHINRVFKKHYGQSIAQYNRTVYLRQAALLLNSTNSHIHLICKQLGFSNRTHFYTLFEEEYGCTPAEYRKKGSHKQM